MTLRLAYATGSASQAADPASPREPAGPPDLLLWSSRSRLEDQILLSEGQILLSEGRLPSETLRSRLCCVRKGQILLSEGRLLQKPEGCACHRVPLVSEVLSEATTETLAWPAHPLWLFSIPSSTEVFPPPLALAMPN